MRARSAVWSGIGRSWMSACRTSKTLDVTMAGLRRRLTQAAEESGRPCRLPHITTLRGHGYRLERCG
ncbi:hypothetical protein [Streptomyces sp. NPDC001135]